MDNVSFTIEEENLICIYHKHDHRRTIAAISDEIKRRQKEEKTQRETEPVMA